jgi:hypothetical protein
MAGANRESIPALFGRMVDGLGRLVADHLQLARIELGEDARAVGKQLAKVLSFVPLLVVGHAFVCAAVAAALSTFVGWTGSLLLVGVANLGLGILGVVKASRALTHQPVMTESLSALEESASTFKGSAS